MSLNVNDASTWRSLAMWINDATVWRKLALWVNDAGTWRRLTSTTAAFTFTAGLYDPDPTFHTYSEIGRSTIHTVGSVTAGNPLPDGKTVAECLDANTGPGSIAAHFSVSGFSSDPGANYFTSLVGNSITLLASAATYSYAVGQANWTWTAPSKFNFVNTTSYPMTINY